MTVEEAIQSHTKSVKEAEEELKRIQLLIKDRIVGMRAAELMPYVTMLVRVEADWERARTAVLTLSRLRPIDETAKDNTP